MANNGFIGSNHGCFLRILLRSDTCANGKHQCKGSQDQRVTADNLLPIPFNLREGKENETEPERNTREQNPFIGGETTQPTFLCGARSGVWDLVTGEAEIGADIRIARGKVLSLAISSDGFAKLVV